MKGYKRFIAASIFFVLLACSAAFAAPTTSTQAENAVKGWLIYDSAPFGKLAGEFSRVEAYGENGYAVNPSEILYYAVYLKPSGIVLLPADDELEPITAYIPDADRYGPEPANPLYDTIGASIAKAVKVYNSGARRSSGENSAREKWDALQDLALSDGKREAPLPGAPSERIVRITDFSGGNKEVPKWSQTGPISGGSDGFAFNSFTPNNYLAGCGAVMLAQLMRSFEWPEKSIDVLTSGREYPYKVNGIPEKSPLLGGDGDGGPYVWAQLSDETIALLMRDCAVAISSDFGSGATASYPRKIAEALTDSFGYRNAVIATSGISGYGQMNMRDMMRAINSNIDAGKPVGLGIFKASNADGHGVVIDAYGFSYGSVYHSVNLGWDIQSNVWFSLPGIYDYDIVDSVIYNIYANRGAPTLGSEIISGRVLASADITEADKPAVGAIVTLTGPGVTTSLYPIGSAGRFFFDGLQSDTEYTLTAALAGHEFPTMKVTTGRSFSPANETFGAQGIGNVWDVVIREDIKSGMSGSCGAAAYPPLFTLIGAGVILLRRKKR
jgi:hypothetical protein